MPTVNLQDVPTGTHWQTMTHSKLVALYSQQEVWISQIGKMHPLTEMPTDYLWNTLRLLERSASNQLYHASWGILPLGGLIQGEMAQDAFDEMIDQILDWELNPWKIPLVRAICAELARRALVYYDWTEFPSRVYTDTEISWFKAGVES